MMDSKLGREGTSQNNTMRIFCIGYEYAKIHRIGCNGCSVLLDVTDHSYLVTENYYFFLYLVVLLLVFVLGLDALVLVDEAELYLDRGLVGGRPGLCLWPGLYQPHG